ncbi:PepSY-like domain-containing protein [Bacteroides sp.]|uniref:PepSY-like domain-containing protein n=1 Tax=Bacteroides sp. TaxID=29523 RepID=UPI00261AA789|nr:PepSY-like domain-containing protein [Bacteroides sp.]MDD3037423.1 PepSY-like domain-containing protein [Bacteroides sp.]
MLRFKFSVWMIVYVLFALSFSACSDDDNDDIYVPPSNIVEALKQLYPNAQNVKWEMKGEYYVADCWLSGDELDVWFDANANWVMTENELDSIDQLVSAVYKAFQNSIYNSWVVTDVYVLTFPQTLTKSVIQVKQGDQRHALYFTQDGGLVLDKNISNGDDTNWPSSLNLDE